MYRYFIQPQLNKFTNSLVGYEMLIRKYDPSDGQWRLPNDLASIPLVDQISLLSETAEKLTLKIDAISFNLNWSQFVSKDMAHELLNVQRTLYPVHLIVEVTEEVSDVKVPLQQMKQQMNYYIDHGIQLSLDDVGSGRNTYDAIKELLPMVSELKFPMQNFRREGRSSEIKIQLMFWKEIAQTYNIRMVVEGIENTTDDALLDTMKIPFRQGYYYGKPHLFKLNH